MMLLFVKMLESQIIVLSGHMLLSQKVLVKRIEKNSVIAGNPAKIVKQGVEWHRERV